MSRVLIAWELGANYGHLARQLPIAEALRDAGHEVMFGVRDTRVGSRVLAPRGFAFTQAPVLSDTVKARQPPATYAELLLAEGYGDSESLLGRVRAWLALFDLWRPRIVIVDHSPTALLAARAASIPAVSVGHGFEIPPDVTPLPTIRIWESIDAERVERSEALALSSVNEVLRRSTGARRLTRLSELFTWSHRVLAIFRELDQFPQRVGADYAGPLFGDVSNEADAKHACGANGERQAVFAYLHNGVSGLRAMLQVLAELGKSATCVVPQLRPEICHSLSTDTLTVTSSHRPLPAALMESELVVCPGGIGVVAQALLAGVPVLMMPGTVEQYLLSQRAQATGGGLCVGMDRRKAILGTQIERLLGEPAFRASAAEFASRYRAFRPGHVVDKVIEHVNAHIDVLIEDACHR